MPASQTKFLTFLLITWCLRHTSHVIAKDCVSQDGCSCEFDDGSGTIDLTSLSNKDGTPRFKDVPYKDAQDQDLMSYNPCSGFSENDCQDAAVCMTQSSGDSQNIGDADSATMKYDDESGHVYAGYQSQDPAVTKVTQIKLICDQTACDPTFTPTGAGSVPEGPSDVIIQFNAELKTVCACPNMCTASGTTNCGGKSSGSGALSVGSIVLIGILCLMLLYMAIGTVYMKVVKKATGTDIIPNKTLWVGGFRLIGTGFKFLLAKCFPSKFSVHKEVQ